MSVPQINKIPRHIAVYSTSLAHIRESSVPTTWFNICKPAQIVLLPSRQTSIDLCSPTYYGPFNDHSRVKCTGNRVTVATQRTLSLIYVEPIQLLPNGRCGCVLLDRKVNIPILSVGLANQSTSLPANKLQSQLRPYGHFFRFSFISGRAPFYIGLSLPISTIWTLCGALYFVYL